MRLRPRHSLRNHDRLPCIGELPARPYLVFLPTIEISHPPHCHAPADQSPQRPKQERQSLLEAVGPDEVPVPAIRVKNHHASLRLRSGRLVLSHQHRTTRSFRSQARGPGDPSQAVSAAPFAQTLPLTDPTEMPRSPERRSVEQIPTEIQLTRHKEFRQDTNLCNNRHIPRKRHQTQRKCGSQPAVVSLGEPPLAKHHPVPDLGDSFAPDPGRSPGQLPLPHHQHAELDPKSVERTTFIR